MYVVGALITNLLCLVSNEHWCARMNGKMIVPPVYTNKHEDLMAENLTKFFRYYLALKQPPSNKNLLLNVELKVSKLQRVKHFGRSAILRNERFEEARAKQDLYTEYTGEKNRDLSKASKTSTYLRTNLSTYLPTYLFTYLSTYQHIYLPIYLPTYLLTYLSAYLSIYLPTYPPICLPTYLSLKTTF